MLRFAIGIVLAAVAMPAAAEAAPATVYVMRHLQKAEGADPGLTDEGKANAQKLAAMLARARPRAIYVSSTRRAQETAAPLAARLHLTPKVYDPRDTAGLVAQVKAERGTVLVVGHSNTVPEIVEKLGAPRPGDLGEADFGDLFKVSRGKVKRLRVGG
jgi:phosphohistidine phosphatase SixA